MMVLHPMDEHNSELQLTAAASSLTSWALLQKHHFNIEQSNSSALNYKPIDK
jgi:hypothetical protein